MRSIALFIFLLCCCGSSAIAQTLTTNEDGEQIVEYPDGSWRYFNTPAENAGDEPELNVDDRRESGSADTDFSDGPPLTAEAEAQARSIARKQTQKQLKVVDKQRKVLAKAQKNERKELSKLAEMRRAGADTDRDKLDVATRTLQERRRQTKEAEAELDRAEKIADVLTRSLPLTSARRQKLLASSGYFPTTNGTNVKLETLNEEAIKREAASQDRPTTVRRKDLNQNYAKYSMKQDPRYYPPASDCTYSYDGIDEFTQRTRRVLKTEVFFAYTTPELKPYLGSESLITAMGNMVQNGSYQILEITFTIRSQYANREFGVLAKSSPLSIKLIDGSTVTLKNQNLAQGIYDPVEKVYTYAGRYPMTSRQSKTLSNALVDQVRVMWGTGFEDYPVYEIDFFKRQLACF